MSFSSQEEVTCPCGETFDALVWNSVNLKEDPDLKEMLLGGALNVHACSMCKRLVYAERFVLVHDPETELLAFVHPSGRENEREFLEAAMNRDTAQAQAVEGGMKIPYAPVLLFGMDVLVDLMQKETEEADQGAVVESMAKTAGVRVLSLPLSKARTLGVPAKLPFLGAGADGLRQGLKAVLAANDRLTVYAELLQKLDAGAIPSETLSALA
jgi:hypothetical protein